MLLKKKVTGKPEETKKPIKKSLPKKAAKEETTEEEKPVEKIVEKVAEEKVFEYPATIENGGKEYKRLKAVNLDTFEGGLIGLKEITGLTLFKVARVGGKYIHLIDMTSDDEKMPLYLTLNKEGFKGDTAMVSYTSGGKRAEKEVKIAAYK